MTDTVRESTLRTVVSQVLHKQLRMCAGQGSDEPLK